MIELRKKSPALVYGDYKDMEPGNPKLFVYTRSLGDEKYLLILNFSPRAISYTLPGGLKAGSLQISNFGSKEEGKSVLSLKGWEARVYKF